MVHIFHFLQTGMVFEIGNSFSWIFNAISSEKSCLISMPFLTCLLDVRTLDFSPPAESWLVNSNFPRVSRKQGTLYSVISRARADGAKIVLSRDAQHANADADNLLS